MAASSSNFPADEAWRMVERIKKELQCKLCLDTLTDPRTLPCHHSFCLQCLKGIIPGAGDCRFNCPICDATVLFMGSVEDVRVNLKLNSLLECFNGRKAIKSRPVDDKTAPGSVGQAVPDDIKCPLCEETFTEPRLLQCGHALCARCIEFMKPASGTSSDQVISCTCCDSKTDVSDGVRSLPLDREKVLTIYHQSSTSPHVMSTMVELQPSSSMHQPEPARKHPTVASAPSLEDLVISQQTERHISQDPSGSHQISLQPNRSEWMSNEVGRSQRMSPDQSRTQSACQPPVIVQPKPSTDNRDEDTGECDNIICDCFAACCCGTLLCIYATVCCPCIICGLKGK